jgi:hypothetical protein
MDRGLGGRWKALCLVALLTASGCAAAQARTTDAQQLRLSLSRSVIAHVRSQVGRADLPPLTAIAGPSLNAELPIPTESVGPSAVPDHALAIDHGNPVRAGADAPLAHAHRPSEGPRLVLVGDSITAALCALFPDSPCFSFPGAWVADATGANLVDQFVTDAQIGPNDTVVLSSIGGWHSPGVDDDVILDRLATLYERLSHLAHRVIVLVAPSPNFDLCINPTTPEARALLGNRHDELCATQAAVAELERSWPITTISIDGPYIADQEHPTPTAVLALAERIVAAL